MRLPVAVVRPTPPVERPGGDWAAVVRALAGRRIVALTGAGLSTDSGIPDYRGPGAPRRSPMTYQEFRRDAAARRRYWARSHVGWARMGHAVPNPGHRALAELERSGALTGLITQNVDGLHAAAGSTAVIDLHGRVADVRCLDCGTLSGRDLVAARLTGLNPGFVESVGDQVATAPDGDAELSATDGFRVADCTVCGGTLKPDVVFFGENVPPARVAAAYAMIDILHQDPTSGGALLVAGSSLTVMSGLRFVRRAHAHDVPVVIVNRGATRGDELAQVRLDAGCSPTLVRLAATVGRPAG